ncbi:MAG: hypothetical protein OXG44_12835 [Gammaproteobacteria bacterium]|nr:hypothetical protein [Gammaproteobacteria bacterium]
MAVVDVEKATVHIDEEPVAPPDFIGLAGQEILVRLGVAGDTTEAGNLKSMAMLAGHRHVHIFRPGDVLRAWSGEFDEVFAEGSPFEESFAFLARLQLLTVEPDLEVGAQRQGGT